MFASPQRTSRASVPSWMESPESVASTWSFEEQLGRGTPAMGVLAAVPVQRTARSRRRISRSAHSATDSAGVQSKWNGGMSSWRGGYDGDAEDAEAEEEALWYEGAAPCERMAGAADAEEEEGKDIESMGGSLGAVMGDAVVMKLPGGVVGLTLDQRLAWALHSLQELRDRALSALTAMTRMIAAAWFGDGSQPRERSASSARRSAPCASPAPPLQREEHWRSSGRRHPSMLIPASTSHLIPPPHLRVPSLSSCAAAPPGGEGPEFVIPPKTRQHFTASAVAFPCSDSTLASLEGKM
jgi:hypothetical protein